MAKMKVMETRIYRHLRLFVDIGYEVGKDNEPVSPRLLDDQEIDFLTQWMIPGLIKDYVTGHAMTFTDTCETPARTFASVIRPSPLNPEDVFEARMDIKGCMLLFHVWHRNEADGRPRSLLMTGAYHYIDQLLDVLEDGEYDSVSGNQRTRKV